MSTGLLIKGVLREFPGLDAGATEFFSRSLEGLPIADAVPALIAWVLRNVPQHVLEDEIVRRDAELDQKP